MNEHVNHFKTPALAAQKRRPQSGQVSVASKQEKEKIHSLFMRAPAAIALLNLIDDKLFFEFANQHFEQLVSLKNLSGKSLAEAFPDLQATNPELYEILYRVARTGERYTATECPILLDWNASGTATERFLKS